MLVLAEERAGYEARAVALHWLGEPAAEPLDEAELSWIWGGQRYPAGALSLVDGRSLGVINPGRPGGGSGPDYLDAVLEIDGVPVRGDVELHVRASGFRAHRHHVDPAYDRVALHVVFRADDGASTRLSCGSEVPVAAFAPWLEGRTSELQGWLSAEAAWREPCRDATGRLGAERVRDILREAGWRRFEAKARALQSLRDELGEGEALWRMLLDQIGVGGDREGFRRLAAAFPAALASEIVAGVAPKEGAARLTEALLRVAGLGGELPDASSGLPQAMGRPLASTGRPANRPHARLGGLAALYARCGGDLAGWARGSIATAKDARALVTAWQVSRDGRALIGPGRARELALNVGLPFAAGDAALRERALGLLAEMRASPAYGKTAFLEANLKTETKKRPVARALEQQGLLAFVGQWCAQGGCGRCPLS